MSTADRGMVSIAEITIPCSVNKTKSTSDWPSKTKRMCSQRLPSKTNPKVLSRGASYAYQCSTNAT